MKKYRYVARDKNGNQIKGEVEATSESVAAKLVRDRGYVLLNLSILNGGFLNISAFEPRPSKSDITAFTRQLATMVNAGLPLAESLAILRLQAQKSTREMLSQILADVEGGESLSVSLSKHPKVFTSTYVALVQAGETGGVLDKVLEREADNMEKQQEFRGKVKGAMIYPAIIVVGMVAVSLVLIVFIMPRLTELYSQFDIELPITTKLLIAFADLVTSYWYLAIAMIFGAGFLARRYAKTKVGQRNIAQIVLKIPIIGELQRQIVLTEITRTMSLMVGAGVPILKGLSVTASGVDNLIIKEALIDVTKLIEKGFPIAYSFAQHPDAFPYIISQMISVGEETGKMEEVLTKVSHVFEVESEQKVKALTAAIEPAIMVVLGIGVAFLVVSVIMPIYNLTTSI